MTATLERTAPAADAKNAVVLLEDVSKTFGRGSNAVTALDGVDLHVGAGEFVCLLGASGCGKSTLLGLVAGLEQPTSGTVSVYSGRPAVVFQEPALMPWLTAARNVELALRLRGLGRTERASAAARLLELVRLGEAGAKRPHELSGGMRQRVALARALATTLDEASSASPLLLMDEPFAALDAITRDVLQAELRRIWAETGTTVLFVTHDVREAVRLGQRVVLLSSRPGRVVQQWTVGKDPADQEELTTEITTRLREVISSHARV